MKKKVFTILLLVLITFSLSSCNKQEKEQNKESAIAFKKEYESMNGKTNKNDKAYRSVTIDEDNPFEKVTAKDILEKINNKETFYVYFGDKLCPWCRSVIEQAIKVAKDKKIDKIYYVNIWDDEGNEILRDKYELENNKPTKTIDGTKEYYELLDKFKKVLSDYTLTDKNNKKIAVGEKRIYAPNFIYVNKGEAKKLVTGNSDLQTDAYQELSEDILNDEKNIFNDFFTN
ncbi:MAG: hypothetical protein IJ574_01845 [Bacilli bacterium]|nr:hypothetical protein [Bacilli bacterium]